MSDDRYAEGFGDGVINSRPWLERAEAAEARCKRLEDLVRESRLRCAWHKREQWCGNVDCYCIRAGHVLEAALSDTAQQPIDPETGGADNG